MGDFGVEVTKEQPGLATFGLKCSATNLTSPDVGVRVMNGPLFASLFVKEKLSVFEANASYKASSDLTVAGKYQQGGKGSGNFTLGLLYNVMKGVAVRAKVSQDTAVQFGVKYEASKGFNVLCGGKYD